MILFTVFFWNYILLSNETVNSKFTDKIKPIDLNSPLLINSYFINMISYNITWFIMSGGGYTDNGSILETILNNVIKRYPPHVEKYFVELMNLEWDGSLGLYKFKPVLPNKCYWNIVDKLVYRLKNTVLEIIIKNRDFDLFFNEKIGKSTFARFCSKIDKVKEYLKYTKNQTKRYITNVRNKKIYYDGFLKYKNNLEYLFEKDFLTRNSTINCKILKLMYFFEKSEISDIRALNIIFRNFGIGFDFKEILTDIFQQIGILFYIFEFDLSTAVKDRGIKSLFWDYEASKMYAHQEYLMEYVTNGLKPHIEKYMDAVIQKMQK
ncbi:hypothetical protein CWI39_1490p0010 [Hamiltosporidium magnivora]|uniref:Uncharacterized protein n=1 Tax=Hamiltosporidium magnivora TaxID=148818 RepID=A0A4Q9L147_9MICR|nr:hypothetical protein CWI39_1490p0010 [Hamiltosporidium magnivora]